MINYEIRSPLARARGLGSARQGSTHWWLQRVTAVTLVPLTIWFSGSLITLAHNSHAVYIAWLRSPFNTVLMVTFVIALFYHMALGLQVVVEDYVHIDRIKLPAIVTIHVGCVLLAVTALVSIVRTIA